MNNQTEIITTLLGNKFYKSQIYSIADIELEIKKPELGINGYFGNSLKDLQAVVDENRLFTLDRIVKGDSNGEVFVMDEDQYSGCCRYRFFLPEDAVQKVSKQYRPFKTLEEFTSTVTPWDNKFLGRCVHIRYKNSPKNELYLKFTGFKVTSGILNFISLGDCAYTPDDLFDNYEFKGTDKAWYPFGLIEKEKENV
jgi:hypothetical protein